MVALIDHQKVRTPGTIHVAHLLRSTMTDLEIHSHTSPCELHDSLLSSPMVAPHCDYGDIFLRHSDTPGGTEIATETNLHTCTD